MVPAVDNIKYNYLACVFLRVSSSVVILLSEPKHSNHYIIDIFPSLFKEYYKLTRFGKVSYERFMYGSGYFFVTRYIIA